jgi:gamma-glutamyltranspeptidase/glutathione hydrolase
MRTPRAIVLCVLTIVMASGVGRWSVPAAQGGRGQPFAIPPADAGKRVEARNGVVTSANALASEAGIEILRAGGNAVDAAVAAAFAIGVVEPQMSGLGGSGAATVWMKRDGKPAYLDFYAAQPVDAWRGHTQPAPRQAPAAARTPNQRGEQEAEQTGGVAQPSPGNLRVVGIPGNVGGLLALHDKYGALTRPQVIAPAIRLAETGFPVGQILADFIAGGATRMKPFPKALALYFPDGKALAPGETLRNPELAEALKRVARDGRQGFYAGATAEALIATLNAGMHPARLVDLAGYQPQWKRPLCTDYRGFTVLSAPPPETGFQVLHTLELLEPLDLKALGLPTRSAAAFDAMTSALRVGQSASRANGDPNWVAVPASGISSENFAAERKALVGTRSAPATIEPADARPFDQARPAGACARYEPYGTAPVVAGAAPLTDRVGERADEQDGETTHLSVVDKEGNAVSLTQTNSSVWGSGGFVEGFFLNDSGFRFTSDNIEAPSRSAWRIRTTTIAPTIVVRDGQVQMVIGAPGGGRIPTEIVQVMVYTLDYGLDPLDAVRIPRIFPSARNARVQVEHGFTPELLRDVRAMGYDPVAESAGYARLYLIVRRGDVWIGVADTRHDGQPRGY